MVKHRYRGSKSRGARALSYELLESRLCFSTGTQFSLTDLTPELLPGLALTGSERDFNLAITTDKEVQQNPSVAIDPGDPERVVLAYMDYSLRVSGYAGLGVAASADGGETWQYRSIPLPAGFDQGASDPIVKFDGQGRVFVSFMAASFLGENKPPILSPGGGKLRAMGFEANNGVFVARSDDGGLSWLPPVAVTTHEYDGTTQVPFEIYPDMAVDTLSKLPDGSANPNYGNLYVTWARYYPAGQFPGEGNSTGGSDVMISVSQDSGLTWQLRARPRAGTDVVETVLQTEGNTGLGLTAGTGFRNQPRVAVGAMGDVSVADFVGAWFFVHRSTDAGANFTVPTQDKPDGLPFGPGPKLLTSGLTNNAFRTVPMRAIAADPARPGHIYVAEPMSVLDDEGNPLDAADIFFARSDDYGHSWTRTILHGDVAGRTVNDDNGGQLANGSASDVSADQFMVRIQVSAQGDVGLVWYDTRRDPENHNLDVFGAISTDGGQTFSPNFRVTDQSFDADQNEGGWQDPETGRNLYFGDAIGLALTEQVAYVAWTDTRAGNQDIFFTKVPRHPLPAALNDQFEPNDAVGSATAIGNLVTRTLPRLALADDDVDWFQLRSLATGTLTVTTMVEEGPAEVDLQIRDASGQQVLAAGVAVRDATGAVVGWQAVTPSAADQLYTVSVSAQVDIPRYSLDVKSLAADLGTVVYRDVSGTLESGGRAYYLLESAASGSISARVTPGRDAHGDVQVELLDANDLSLLATAGGETPQVDLAVKLGQRLLVRVTESSGSASGFHGAFRLQVANLDQFSVPAQDVLQFPAGAGPSQLAVADFNRDGVPDIAVSNTGMNTVSVSLANGDGTFATPRRFAVGAFRTPNPVGDDAHLNTYRRDILAADFNGDHQMDLAVTNYDSADVSILLGRGDGTFQPQRRFDAAAFPIGLNSGDVNGDGQLDLVVIDSPEINIPNKLAVLLGRGDGTFWPQQIQELPNILFLAVTALADLNHDGALDLVVGGGINDGVDVFRGKGDGTFVLAGHFPGTRQATSLSVSDLDGDGNPDIVAASLNDQNAVVLLLGNGNLEFAEPIVYDGIGQGPLAVIVVDWGSQISLDDESTTLGPPDRRPDLIVAASGVIPGPFIPIGPPEIVVLPRLAQDPSDKDGSVPRFGDPQRLSLAEQPLDLQAADFNGDGALDTAVVDRRGFFVIFGEKPHIRPNVTRETARVLGTVVHLVQPTLTLLPGRDEAWFRLQVPSEALADAGDQVMDFSGGFAHESGGGLRMEVLDALDNVRGAGERFRVAARQGETLWVHIFNVADSSGDPAAGAFTLVVGALPQLVAVEAPTLLPGQDGLPGGPVAGLVLVFQGDRLDPATAENPDHYRVTWLGPDGRFGTGDDRVFPVGAGVDSSRPAIYNPSGNRDIASGRTYPTAVRQTVTLLFSQALPAGSYLVEVSPRVQAAPFNEAELGLLSQRVGFSDHPVVSLVAGDVLEGIGWTADDLVYGRGTVTNFQEFEAGTRFLTQLHTDLGALLDSLLSDVGDQLDNTGQLLDQVVATLSPALGPFGERLVSLLVIVLDPVSIALLDPLGRTFGYDLQANVVANNLPQTYVQVGGNVELVVIAQPQGVYQLDVQDVPPLARGGYAFLGNHQDNIRLLTAELRDGARSFRLGENAQAIPAPLTPLAPSAPAIPTRVAKADFVVGSTAPKSLKGTTRSKEPYFTSRWSTGEDTSDRWSHIWDRWQRYWKRLRSNLNQTPAVRNALEIVMPFLLDRALLWNVMRNSVDVIVQNLKAERQPANLDAAREPDRVGTSDDAEDGAAEVGNAEDGGGKEVVSRLSWDDRIPQPLPVKTNANSETVGNTEHLSHDVGVSLWDAAVQAWLRETSGSTNDADPHSGDEETDKISLHRHPEGTDMTIISLSN